MPKTKPDYNTERLTVRIPVYMHEQIKLLTAKKQSATTASVAEADIIREAIEMYLAHQDAVWGTRAYFTNQLQKQLTAMVKEQKERDQKIEDALLRVANLVLEQPAPPDTTPQYYALSYQIQTANNLLDIVANTVADPKGKSPQNYLQVAQARAQKAFGEQMRNVADFVNRILPRP